MWSWLKQIILSKDESQAQIKSFEEETAHIAIQELRKAGVESIETDKVIGSVGRAHELNKNFKYRERAVTGRYHSIESALQQGKPMEPIKVFRLKRKDGNVEYYVVDGHHRVAQAKQHGYPEINADVTDVIVADDDTAS